MPNILEFTEAGDKSSNNLVVFLQGWPDNATMWQWINWREDLVGQHLLFVNFPNTNGKVDQRWGRDFLPLIEDLKFTIDSLKVDNKNKLLVAHDWGCVYGYILDKKYPQFFSQIIAMDVPGKVELKSLKEIFYVLAYQLTLIIAFLIGGKIGQFITQSLVKLFRHNPPYAAQINSSQNYPYFYMFKNEILSKLKRSTRFLAGYHPSVPVTYLYGAIKPFQFHGAKWIKMVEESGGEVHKIEGGHWFMKKYAKFITDLIIKKLQTTKQ